MRATAADPRAVGPAEVRARLGEPAAMIDAKVFDRLDRVTRRFIAHSPFLTMATADGAGRTDCTPRGDHPGFVRVLDDRTVAVPDRPGNRRGDSFGNLARNDGVALLFLIPGVSETLRLNGAGWVTDEPDVLARMRVGTREPELAVVVRIVEVYLHCGRALLRSRLWDPASQALAEEIPTPGQMLADQLDPAGAAATGLTAAAVDDGLASSYRKLH